MESKDKLVNLEEICSPGKLLKQDRAGCPARSPFPHSPPSRCKLRASGQGFVHPGLGPSRVPLRVQPPRRSPGLPQRPAAILCTARCRGDAAPLPLAQRRSRGGTEAARGLQVPACTAPPPPPDQPCTPAPLWPFLNLFFFCLGVSSTLRGAAKGS